MSPEIKIVSKKELGQILQDWPINTTTALLFGGDRFYCVDWGAVAILDGVNVGLATVAEDGEMRSGIPTLVGLAVLADYRRKGIGTKLLQAIITKAQERNLCPLLVETVTADSKAFIAAVSVPEGALNVWDIGLGDWGVEFKLPFVV